LNHPDEEAVLALVGAWDSQLPRSSVANILRGALSSDVIKKYGHEAFAGHYGNLKGRDYSDLMALIDAMLDGGRLTLRSGHLELSRDGNPS
jgi:hypothetical protein